MVCGLAKQTHVDKAPDPIFGLIENHQRAAAEYDRAVDAYDEDDPALDPILDALGDAERQAGIDLINEARTSAKGGLAILRYASEVEAKGCRWPDNLLEDGEDAKRLGRPWEYFLHRNLVEALTKIAAA